MKKTSLFLLIMAFIFNGIPLSAQVQTGVFRTPAAEMKEKGIDMADMQVKLLQKVEELTLYVIQQQKEIEELINRSPAIIEMQNFKLQPCSP